MLSSLSNPRSRYPLYTGLLAILGGSVLAAALSLWGGLEMQWQFQAAFTELMRLCSPPPQAPSADLCTALEQTDRALLERLAVTLLLQGLCFALILAGAALLARHGYTLLVRRTDAALGLTSESARMRGRDEVGRLVESLAELSARQAALEAEERWQRQTSGEQLRCKSEALQALHEVARIFCAGDVSEFSLARGLALIETALGARTVALCLGEAARQALGTSGVLSSHGEPAIVRRLALEMGARETTSRIVPPSATCDSPSLVVPVSRGDTFVGTLVAEFSPAAQADNLQLELAESFSHLVALAVSNVSRSQEDRRVALMEERSAIAAELHDSLAQSLGFMKIQVARLQRRLERDGQPADVAQMARELREGLSAAYGEVRELITAFRARMGSGGLVATVQETIDELGQRGSLDIGFVHDLGRSHLEVNEEFHVMQVIREALSNVIRHARAQHAWVSTSYGPEHLFTVIVEDDGRGLDDPHSAGSHYGLSIMRERARSLGGEITVAERPGGGTRVRLTFAPQRLPIDPQEDVSA